MQNYLPACKIVSTHGVRGEMKALPLCDGAAFLAKFKRLFARADGTGEVRVLGVRAQGNVILLRLEGVADIARLPKGRYFIDDLLGCRVVDAGDGREYGTLTAVDHPAAQDIYTVTDAEGGTHMLPAVPEFVQEIDLENRTVTFASGTSGVAINAGSYYIYPIDRIENETYYKADSFVLTFNEDASELSFPMFGLLANGSLTDVYNGFTLAEN